MTYAHLPILQILIPLIAHLCARCSQRPARPGLRDRNKLGRVRYRTETAKRVLEAGSIQYEIGGWAPPWGIAYVLDATNALVLIVVTANWRDGAHLCTRKRGKGGFFDRLNLFYATFLLCLTGLLGIAITGDCL